MDIDSKISSDQKKSPIYVIVPGFVGNYFEGFVKRLYDFLTESGLEVWPISFRGHDPSETELASLDEMVTQIAFEYAQVKKKYSERPVVFLAHSQGCAVTLKVSAVFDQNTTCIFFAPAVFLSRIILPRISPADLRLIESGQRVNCRISQTKWRIIDLDWVLSYRNFSLEKALTFPCQKCLVVRPQDDWLEKENSAFLLERLVNCDYWETEGDHAFEPEAAFAVLAQDFFHARIFEKFFIIKKEH